MGSYGEFIENQCKNLQRIIVNLWKVYYEFINSCYQFIKGLILNYEKLVSIYLCVKVNFNKMFNSTTFRELMWIYVVWIYI